MKQDQFYHSRIKEFMKEFGMTKEEAEAHYKQLSDDNNAERQ